LTQAWWDDRASPAPLPRPTVRSAWRNVLLFALTAGSIYVTGGPRLAVALLAILLAHEMGHYLACRHYRVDATLPFFIPLPILSFVGTLGAFIRIRSRIPHRRALIDIGAAGPLAGFVVCLPVLYLGVREAQVLPRPPGGDGLSLGEPLLFQWAARALLPPIPEGMELAIGPLGLAAWFGLLVTALNLMPVGQLDGGHVVYALARRWHRHVSLVGVGVCLVLLYFHPAWLLWSVFLLVLSRQHPPTRDDERPPGPARLVLGLAAFAVFAVCFTPSPFLLSWADFGQAWSELLTSR
jgi:membrane-associated protease RseP (regulator of RpoE activity)